MTSGQTPAPPRDIMELAQLIHKLRGKSYVTRADRDTIRRAKLRIAFWACRNERLPITRENLSFVMGADAEEIISAYDRHMENKTGVKSAKTKKSENVFWDGA